MIAMRRAISSCEDLRMRDQKMYHFVKTFPNHKIERTSLSRSPPTFFLKLLRKLRKALFPSYTRSIFAMMYTFLQFLSDTPLTFAERLRMSFGVWLICTMWFESHRRVDLRQGGYISGFAKTAILFATTAIPISWCFEARDGRKRSTKSFGFYGFNSIPCSS
jgi:hypothetical protein